MNKILISIMTMGIVAALMGAGTFAYFQDSVDSNTNSFTAGLIDLKIDVVSVYDQDTLQNILVTATDGPQVIFSFTGVMPGDSGTAEIDLDLIGRADLSMDGTEGGGAHAGLGNAINVHIWLESGAYAGYQSGEDTELYANGPLKTFIDQGSATSIKADAQDETCVVVMDWTFPDTGSDQSTLMSTSYGFDLDFIAQQP